MAAARGELEGQLRAVHLWVVVVAVHTHEQEVNALDVTRIIRSGLSLVHHVGSIKRESIAVLAPLCLTLTERPFTSTLVGFNAVLRGVLRHVLAFNKVGLVAGAELGLIAFGLHEWVRHLGVQRSVVSSESNRRVLGLDLRCSDIAGLVHRDCGRFRIDFETEGEIAACRIAVFLHRSGRLPVTVSDSSLDVGAPGVLDTPVESAGFDGAGFCFCRGCLRHSNRRRCDSGHQDFFKHGSPPVDARKMN